MHLGALFTIFFFVTDVFAGIVQVLNIYGEKIILGFYFRGGIEIL